MERAYISCCGLQSGESVALGALEITSVPHVSIIDDRPNAIREVLERYKTEMSGLLGEVYQSYKTAGREAGRPADMALELLWTTRAVPNQPFSAQISLYLIARTLDADAERAAELTGTVLELCRSTLALQRYDCRQVDYQELAGTVARVKDGRVLAVVREEKAANLQNQLLPFCYSYDRLPASGEDLSRIVNALIDHPDCAVSMQLIPTALTGAEAAEIDSVAQVLQTLSRGVMDHGVGNVSFTLAEKHAELYKYYAGHKNGPLFAFNILVYGAGADAANIASRVYGQLASGGEQTAELKTVELTAAETAKDANFYPLPWAVNETLLQKQRDGRLWSSGAIPAAFYRLPYIVTGEEAAEFFRLPIGSDRVSAGLNVNASGKSSRTYSENVINAGDITVGRLRASARGDTVGFSLRDLAKHMLVVGTPGSGKTTFSVSLLDRLWKEHHVPFLVIEPAKNEYRALVQSIPELQVFTPGKNFISPFVYNPFVPPKNVRLETYKSTLKTAFSAAVSMTTPLDKIFEESINNCYSDFRWLDTYTSDDQGRVFNISDFIKCFQKTFDEIGYTGDAKNIGRAGVVRLSSLVNLFDNYFSIPIEDLLQKPTVIELAAIENADEKALIIALLLLSILAYVNSNYLGEGGLKNVILLEEAHVLLDAESNGQADANPSAIAQGLVKRMLAEIRSYGVGIIIADQSPRKVTSDVVALTDMKLVFRLVESADKQIVADSTNMSEAQMQRLSRLKPGEAFLFFGKLDEPEEVITPDYRLENNISITLSDEGIRQLSTYWADKQQLLRPYPQCRYCRACRDGCDYGRRVLGREIARRIFTKNFTAASKGFDGVLKVFRQISRLVMAELNDEPFTPELLSCVKVHLWRRIYYGTNIPVREIQIENSLKK